MPSTDRTIRVGTINVTVRTSNRTTLDVTVTKRGDIVLRGPHTTTDTDAAALVERRRAWIYRRLTHLAETLPHNPLKHLTTGEEFTVLGQPHRLQITPDTSQQRPLTSIRDPRTGDRITLHSSTAP
ncbi:YgjP-like metallopeptidase domain-containing protein [Streptomyces sp. NPDC001401]|uniref:YgjP-like metallopeptidase domain-containing protein n=1 Tax=Streptomyces sp. NPDC001401 TaxID=3364570 RepID=UPI0036824DA6